MEYREFRAEEVGVDEETGELFGTAVPLGRETVIGDLSRGGWHEQVAPGAATKTLREQDIVFLAHHDMHQPLARVSAGNLSLREEGDRVRYSVNPVDTSYGRDIRALAKAKVLGGVSIGFQPVKDEWRNDKGEIADKYTGTHRILREIRLIEISAVTNPAYKDTSIMARDELLAERETRAERASQEKPEWPLEEAAGLLSLYNTLSADELDALPRALREDYESRASSVSAEDRRGLAKKGHALPDGSYPIPDIAHLHAAAILAASHHGDWKAAKELIRRRARELGVNVDSLPGMGANDGDKPEGKRDDPDGHEYAAIDTALKQLRAGDAKGAEQTLAANQAQRAQEPEASTPDDDDDNYALRIAEEELALRSRERRFA